jgi:serine/threonine-protein kinase
VAGSDHSEAASDPLIGSVVGDRYRITGVLGTGGMGTVYRAEHQVIGKAVALKVLRDFGDNTVFVRRFEREASATGRIEHPNCVTASDGGQLADGRLFLAMELVAGEGLADVLRVERRLPVDRALRICGHVLRGLAFAHKAGVVHRDIKPENIVLVETDGDPDFAKILDFGIAKLLDDAELSIDEQKATQIGTTIGTPTYMCPEQAFGQQVDGRADLYATGVMLFEMIAGRPPYEAENNGTVLSMHVRDPIPAIGDVSDVEVPASLDELLREALAKERRDRIASAELFLERIEAIAAAPIEPVYAPPDTPAPVLETVSVDSAPAVAAPTAAITPLAAAVTLPRPSARGRWTTRRLVGAGAGALAVLGLIALAGGGGEGGVVTTAPQVGAKAAPPEPITVPTIRPMSTAAVEAKGIYEQGDHRAVVEYLEAKRPDIKSDVDALLLLGHGYTKLRRIPEALSTYRAVAGLDATIGDEPEVVAACKSGLSSRNRKSRAAARELVTALIGGFGSKEIRELVKQVAVSDDLSDRKWARALGKKHGVKIDMLQSLARDLDQERKCEDRKKVVAAIAELGDRDAIPILDDARRRVRRAGFLRLRRRNSNACLADDIDRAILQLR